MPIVSGFVLIGAEHNIALNKAAYHSSTFVGITTPDKAVGKFISNSIVVFTICYLPESHSLVVF